MATKAKAPAVTGLAISQSGTKIVCSFKVNKHAAKVETQYRLGTAAWKTVSNNEKSCSVTVNTNNYAPNAGKPTVPYIEFKVRQYIDMKYVKSSLSGKKWSAWTTKRYTFAAPNGLKSYAELGEDDPNKTSYHFTGTNSPASAFFKNIEYQSILAFESNIADGSKLSWNASQPGWRTGTVTGSVEDGVRSGSVTITEDSEVLALGAQTRWVRFRSRGIAKNSAWTYTKHVYAQPYKPTNLEVKKAELQQSYYQCSLNWETPSSASHPVDYIQLQYAVAVPTASQEPPSGASWTDIIRLAPKDGTDGYSFVVPETLEEDECLFLRVASYHDTEQNYNASTAVIAATGNLADPEDLSVVTDDTTHKATITATNKSTVPGSFLAIKYIPASNPQNAFYVGIIPNGQSSVQVQCPNWDAETAFAFTVQAFAGTYTAKQRADGAYTYELDTWMESAGVLKDGGAVPVAPANVTAVPTNTSGTIRVAWDWSWESANKAILSWADHEDAWESTVAPSTYEVEGIHAPVWNISGLETGKTWYIRVALAEVNGENETQSPWSDIIAVDLASAPSVPTLVLDKSVIAADDSFTASWGYVSTDGTAQAYAVLCLATITPNGIVYGDEIAHTQTAQHITLTASELGWTAGNTYHLCVKVTSASGKVSDSWSDPVALTIAEALTATIDSTSLVEETIAYNEQTLTPGTIVSFEADSEKTFTELTATIVPKQSGSGTPSPDNIRPISGWESVETSVCGVNVWDEEWEQGSLSTADGNNVARTTRVRSANYISVVPNETYYFKIGAIGISNGLVVCFYDRNKTFISGAWQQNESITIPNNAHYVRFSTGDAYGGTYNHDISINYPSTDHDYHAYTATTHTTSLGRTVYGGTVDVVSGQLVDNMAIVDLGTLNWINHSSGVFWAIVNGKKKGVSNIVCSQYETSQMAGVGNLQNNQIVGENGGLAVYIKDTRFTTDTTEFKAAMNGVQLCYELATPQTYTLTPQTINTLSGVNNVWADCGSITKAKIADAVLVALCLTEMPLTATITGAGAGGTTILAIERAQDYQMARPDGDTSDGFESQTVALFSQMGEEEISIDNADLIGHLDDGAWYKIVATVQDGFGQSASAEEVFLVRWSHQALMPEAEAEPIEEYNAMMITPIPPNGTAEGDTFDIYRLSADKPELIVEGGEWGTTYVDPYPAIRELGGHRVVFKTKNGDYITEDNNLAWINLAKDEDDYIDRDCSIIDFEGAELIVRLNMSVSDEYEKQFTETRYKGGSVVGDWNKGISRKGAVKAVALAEDLDTVLTLRELARYEGVCHVRTPNGTSYAADVQVDLDQSFEDVERAVSFNLTITRVDGQELDGMTLEEWQEMHPEESE